MEVYVQVIVQVLILLLARTETATTGGLENVFEQELYGLDPYTLLAVSISWSLLSSVQTHLNLIAIEKGFCSMSTKLLLFLWGTFATLRRILSLIALFVPSMGLFSILHHWRWEQLPFSTRLEYARRGFMKPDDKITLYGLNETIYWSELDRWDYSYPEDPKPPPYTIYTLFSIPGTIIAAAILLAVQFLLITEVKILTSPEFRKKDHYLNKFIHVFLSLNYATPFCDWDEGDHSIEEYR